MRALTIYAHHDPKSFRHAVLAQFCAGLAEAGHANAVADLHAIGFNPLFSERDTPNGIDDSAPDDVLTQMNFEGAMVKAAGRNRLRSLMTKRWIGGACDPVGQMRWFT
jgi:NAD(P)H dehydrogenase (quinone)